MDATLYTGNGANRSITNAAGFRPDLVIGQARSAAYGNWWYDSVRGATKQIESFSTNAESTQATMVTAFNSNGFSLGTDTAGNNTGTTYVAWQWNAGGSTVTNTSGSISSQVRANPTAGFSVVTYTGNGTAGATIGHGLGVAPKMFIVKNRSNGGNDWSTWHTSISPSSNFQVYLSSSAASLNTWNVWNSTSPSSTTLTLGTDALVNGNGQTYVAYCWAEIAGFSKFGSYTGNFNADGPFIYTGFRPKFVLLKASGDTGNWNLLDGTRNPSNVANARLRPNISDAEVTTTFVDFLSNGFKIRTSDSDINYTVTNIYMAFAENPFKNANAK
jgi:hypothetical protein